MTTLHQQKILILDFGSQTTQLIARRVRECGVYCEIHPYDLNEQTFRDFAPIGIILSGGPESVWMENVPALPPYLLTLSIPILGICYGMQALAQQLGGKVIAAKHREFGHATVELRENCPLFQDIEDHVSGEGIPQLDVWMSHGDQVSELPPEFLTIASSDHAPIAAFWHPQKHIFGVQFHPEVTHTRQGSRLLRRFVRDLCGCDDRWNTRHILHELIPQIQAQVGHEHVLLGLSGGVDSAVVAALLHRAIGTQLTCVFVDTGLLRLGESEQVMATFARHLGVNVIRVDAAATFFQALAGVADPEEKRKIIGRLFVETFEATGEKLQDIQWLAQGTIYPDVIESAGAKTGKAKVIKSHHNVGGLPARMKWRLLEPLRELFKDEVRALGTELGLPSELVDRHPFPGPGLAVRILGPVDREKAEQLRQADAIFIDALRQHGLYEKVSQAFAVYLPVNSVAVLGDGRVYAPVIALRAVETTDFMTANWAKLPWDFLDEVARQIVNRVPNVSRVVYDISGKPPATIEWE